MTTTPWKEVRIPKKSGGYRKICIPEPALKKQLRSANKHLLEASQLFCTHAHAFIPGRSVVTAAMKHRGFAYTLSCDLVEFFDNVSKTYRDRVFCESGVKHRTPTRFVVYDNAPIGPDLQHPNLTRPRLHVYQSAMSHFANVWELCHQRVPQGFPTSPAMANLLSARMDALIVQELHHHDPEAVYTRYADDLTISSNSRVAIDEMRKRLPRLVGLFGHTCHPNKWQLQTAAFGKRIVCGVAIGTRKEPLTATRATRRRLRAMQHKLDTGKRTSRKHRQRTQGLREWCRMPVPSAPQVHRRWQQFLLQISALSPGIARMFTKPNYDWFHTGIGTPPYWCAGYLAVCKPRWRSRYLQSPTQFRYALRLARYLCSLGVGGLSPHDLLRYSMLGAAVFGENAVAYVKRGLDAGITPHDSLYFLPTGVTPMDGLGRWILDITKSTPKRFASADGHSELRVISNAWLSMGPEDRKLPIVEMLASIRAKRYKDAKLPEFVVAAAKADVSSDAYGKHEQKWIRLQKALTHECIPRGVVADADSYRTEFLQRDNPESVYAGAYVNCCQYPGSAAGSSAWHGATHPEGAILAVYHNDRMVAQSWVWRSGSTVVFDNCEAIKRNYPGVVERYEQAAAWLLGKLGITEVRIGGGNDIEVKQWRETMPLPTPNKCYSDAKQHQRVIARLELK